MGIILPRKGEPMTSKTVIKIRPRIDGKDAAVKSAKKRSPHRVSAHITSLSYILRSALEHMGSERRKSGVDEITLPPALFDAAMVYATLIAEDLNRVGLSQLTQAVAAYERGTLNVDSRMLVVSDGEQAIY